MATAAIHGPCRRMCVRSTVDRCKFVANSSASEEVRSWRTTVGGEVLGLFGLLLAASATAGVGILGTGARHTSCPT